MNTESRVTNWGRAARRGWLIASVALAVSITARAEDDREELIEHGSYLVHRVTMCVQCHSARSSTGELLDRGLLKGAVMPLTSPFAYQVWAFRAPQISGLPTGYSEDDMTTLLMQGRTKSGTQPRHPMPPYRLNERDARAIAAYLAWVGQQTQVKDVSIKEEKAEERARAVLNPVGSSGVAGVVTFVRQKNLVHVIAEITGLTPGLHSIHIDTKGECGGAAEGSTGGHFNPDGMPHGAPNAVEHHLGDLGNVVADENGIAHYERFDPRLTFEGERSILGRAVVIDEKWDDLKTQPDGASGAPIACGVIDRF